MTSLIDNERTKLLANALDRASTACLTVGVVAPLAAALYNFGGVTIQPWVVVLGVVIWLSGAVVLHLTARSVLGGLTQ
jgi:hypothetical protein